MSWQYKSAAQNAIFTFAGSINAGALQGTGNDPEGPILWGIGGASPEFFWGKRAFDAPEFTAFDAYVTYSQIDISWDEPAIVTMQASLFIRTDEGVESLHYDWQFEATWPNITWAKSIAFSVTVTVPMKVSAQLRTLPALEGTELWKRYPTAKTPNWMEDRELRLSWERDEDRDIVIDADLMGETGQYVANSLYEPDQFGMIACRPHASAELNPTASDWDTLCSISLGTGGCLQPTNFGAHDYKLGDFTALSLSGSSITCAAPEEGLAEGPELYSYIAAHSVEYTGDITYLEGLPLEDVGVIAGEEAPVWDPVEGEWGAPNDGITSLEQTGGTVDYLGQWQLDGLFGYGGDYKISDSVARCDSVAIVVQDEEEWTTHGGLYVDQPGDHNQPEYAATAEPNDETFADKRILLTVPEQSTIVSNLIGVSSASGSRKVAEWLYSGLANWTYDTEKLLCEDDGHGKIKVTCLNASGSMSIGYAACRKEAGPNETDNWLGCRYFELDIAGANTDDFNIQVAGRTYLVSTQKPRVDVLTFAEELPYPPTQSLLPTFQPEAIEPPTVTDIPKDWGIYQPGTIVLSGFAEGASYVLDGITLVRTSAPKLLILPEPQWVGWKPNYPRDPSVDGDPQAFFDAGEDHWAHRIGFVLMDGMVVAEIVSTVFEDNEGWTIEHPAFSSEHNYMAFPHPVTVLATVALNPAAVSACAYEWDEEGDLSEMPIAYLAGPVALAQACGARLSFSRLTLPPNMVRPVLSFAKYYGGVGLVRVADPTRNYPARPIDVTTGCEGDYSAETDQSSSFLTWGDGTETKTLRQYSQDNALHEWSAAVTDGDEGSAFYDVRNRALSVLTIQSESPEVDPEDPPPVPNQIRRLWQPDILGSFMNHNHPLGV